MEVKDFLVFGPFRADVRRRALSHGGEVIPLPPKAFDVLVALLQRPGETVSKDELMKAVWPDTFVEEGNLTQMIFLLRKALGDSDGGQPFIVTVPRQGYRFVGHLTNIPVDEPLVGAPAEQPASAPVIASRRGVLPWVVAGTLAVIAAGATWFAWRASQPAPALHPVPVPVTSYPGSESSPALSPDGKYVAFVWGGERDDNLDIYVTLVTGGGPPLRLTKDPGRDTAPAWSPDGSQIAFYRNDSVYLISPLGGVERRLAEIGHGINLGPLSVRPASLAWSPDGKWLAATDRASDQYESSAVTLINVLTGEKRHLTKPALPGDTQCAFSPDGSRIVFVRWVYPQGSDLYEVPVAGGEPVRLTRRSQNINGLAWIPGTGDVAFSSQGILFRMAARAGAVPKQVLQNEDGIGSLAISPSGRLIFTRFSVDMNIWELASGETTPRQVVASTRWDGYPQLSPDGSRIAFSSNRSGPTELWICDRDGKNATQLTSLGGESHSERWSPDGSLLVFACLRDGRRDIYTVRSDGGALRRLTTERTQAGRPSFSRDGKWVYFYSDRTARRLIWKMPVDGGPAIQVTKSGGYEAQESWDGKKVYFTLGSRVGLKSIPAQGGEETFENQAIRPRTWDVTQKGIVYVENDMVPVGRRGILLWDPDRRETTQLGVIEMRRSMDTNRWFFANADASLFLWSQIDRQESDLMLIENFR